MHVQQTLGLCSANLGLGSRSKDMQSIEATNYMLDDDDDDDVRTAKKACFPVVG